MLVRTAPRGQLTELPGTETQTPNGAQEDLRYPRSLAGLSEPMSVSLIGSLWSFLSLLCLVLTFCTFCRFPVLLLCPAIGVLQVSAAL